MADAPAAMIGRYRVLAALGAGAMGTIVRARDERLGREVAIKRVKNVRGLTAAIFLARFEAEARALAALSHPGVVAVYDSGVADDEPYLVMELLAGPSLKDELARRGPLPAGEVIAIGIQLARALEAAHARGILHRDVKPANVVRAADGTWKLVDFGVAHLPDSDVTLAGQFVGTPSYAAPEALTLGRTSPQSDVFALAATLLEIATGAKPRADLTLADVIAKSDAPVVEPAALARLGPLAPAIVAGLAIVPDRRPDAAGLAALLAARVEAAAPAPSSTEATAPPALVTPPTPSSTGATTPLALITPPAAGAPAAHSSPGLTATWSPRATRGLAIAVAAVFVLGLIGLGLRCDDTGGPAAGPAPAAGLAPRGDDLPVRFDPPADLDDKGARDWSKIADKVRAGDLREALNKLRGFERKRGVSPETLRLRAWLEAHAGD
ncbi:MAG: serine/threonine protein kinase [Myxococcales bacterium]|nr:serine/threonine protein kinase [Myxococcales bacterium]